MRLRAIRDKEQRFAIGLMSGSSCDGIDAALVRLKNTGDQLRTKLIDHRTMRFPPTIRDRLLKSTATSDDIAGLDFILGQLFAEAAKSVMDSAKQLAEPVVVDFIASHGHTIMHAPRRNGTDAHGTLQIGNPSVLSRMTGLPVASNFRPRDIAAGGQGAPLTAYADWILFRQQTEPVACLNIGGIANVTIATPDLVDVIAFDTGPGNMPIDGAIRHLTNGRLQFDKNGRRAARGKTIGSMLDQLMEHPYFDQVPPKSTGREEFGFEAYLADVIASDHDHTADDVVATLGASKAHRWVVGFALETEDHRLRALAKLERKCCDLIVSNGVEAMHSKHNRVEIIAPSGEVLSTAEGEKALVAEQILEVIERRLIRSY